ncbi:hypothetical protein B0T22DRAFT_446399 [Podospora appendiculata]|uniref:Uncharacterized protein n=1 Tax=Podospora appendiculata TaxID=314037 RepID=A0AAE1CFA2_9PEZI|nr:hypothetical protein B0T22DRAFT_446399 [Podospora appendiculata]
MPPIGRITLLFLVELGSWQGYLSHERSAFLIRFRRPNRFDSPDRATSHLRSAQVPARRRMAHFQPGVECDLPSLGTHDQANGHPQFVSPSIRYPSRIRIVRAGAASAV